MRRSSRTRAKSALSGLILFLGLICAGIAVIPQELITGSDEFRISCASCHGMSGKGDGQVAAVLTLKPADLTSLSKNNLGEFPEMSVYRTIDGREAFLGHGDRAMPVWGIRYLAEHAVRFGDSSEQVVQERITKLVDFIRSIQE